MLVWVHLHDETAEERLRRSLASAKQFPSLSNLSGSLANTRLPILATMQYASVFFLRSPPTILIDRDT